MAQSKHQFYHKGADTQKRADITVDLRRPDTREIRTWTDEQRREMMQWLAICERAFAAFKQEILSAA